MVNTSLEFSVNNKNVTDKILKFFTSLTLTDKKGTDSDSVLLNISDTKKELGEPESLVNLSVTVNGLDKGTFEVNDTSGDIHTGEIEISGTAMETRGGIKLAKSRTFELLTVSDLVSQIAGEHGYTPVIGDDVSSINLGHINQDKESDLNLLTRLASDNNATFKISHERLLFIGADTGRNATGDDLPIMIIDDPATTSGRWSSVKRDKITGVKVGWFNDAENDIQFEEIGSLPFKELKRQGRDKEEAMSLATSEFKRQSKGGRSLELSIPLNVKYIAGCKVDISNHGFIDGEWMIESMTHNISLSSYDNTLISLVQLT